MHAQVASLAREVMPDAAPAELRLLLLYLDATLDGEANGRTTWVELQAALGLVRVVYDHKAAAAAAAARKVGPGAYVGRLRRLRCDQSVITLTSQATSTGRCVVRPRLPTSPLVPSFALTSGGRGQVAELAALALPVQTRYWELEEVSVDSKLYLLDADSEVHPHHISHRKRNPTGMHAPKKQPAGAVSR
jgi:hypothetical protein